MTDPEKIDVQFLRSFQLITCSELHKKLAKEEIVIVDARRKYHFKAGHIPNAVCMRWEQWCEPSPSDASTVIKQPGWWGKLADPTEAKFAESLGAIGITNTTPIVVYADGARSKGRDSRIAWMLLYLGARDVYLLNGGWQAWLENGETQMETVSPAMQKFQVELDPARRILIDEFCGNNLPGGIDTRSPEEHRGEIYDYQPRMGRIPGSINIPFQSLYQKNGEFLGKEEFGQLISTLPTNAKDLFSYCEVGVRAAAFSLLHELYSGEKLPVYDGSFMEWAFDARRMVQTS